MDTEDGTSFLDMFGDVGEEVKQLLRGAGVKI